jgi:hypothetical protein
MPDPSPESSCHPATQEFSTILWNLKVYYHVHMRLELVHVLNHVNPISSTPSYFPQAHLNIIPKSYAGCQKCQQIFISSGHVLISKRAKNHNGPSQMNKMDDPFL